MSDRIPSVAVLMSTYNGEKYLREQIDSILNQSEVDIQLVIRDDGSADGTKKILQEYRKNKNITINLDGGQADLCGKDARDTGGTGTVWFESDDCQ